MKWLRRCGVIGGLGSVGLVVASAISVYRALRDDDWQFDLDEEREEVFWVHAASREEPVTSYRDHLYGPA